MSNLPPRSLRRTAAALGVLALTAGGVVGCSSSNGSGGQQAKASASPAKGSPSATPSGPTKPGTRLGFGQAATVAYSASGKQATLRLTVRSVRQSTTRDLRAYQLDKQTRASTPYYVRYSIENVSPPAADKAARKAASIGGIGVPLYALTDRNTLVQSSSFTTDFGTCPSSRLPKRFGPGRSQRGCLVFLTQKGVHLVGVSYRPDMKVDGIVWRGRIQTPRPPSSPKTPTGTPSPRKARR